jgi:ADP-heptose:LPS heptosyltransferase
MRFLCVTQTTRADIFGQEYFLNPLDPRKENLEDILVTDNTSAAELLKKHPEFLMEIRVEWQGQNHFPSLINSLADIHPDDKILILRNGGIGDHVMLLPALAVFRERFPSGARIWLASQKEKHALFLHNPHIDRLLALPLRLTQVLEADGLIDFSSRQDWYDLESLPITDSYLNFLKIDYAKIAEKTPRLFWSQDRSPAISARLDQARKERPHKPFVLLNWTASNRLRDIPPQQLLFLVSRYQDVCFLVAQPSHLQPETTRIIATYRHQLLDYTPWMHSLEDYLGLIINCDAVVSTDTATLHLAAALGKPGLVLYGPTRDRLWIQYYQNVFPLRAKYIGKTCRSPCGLTKDTAQGCPETVLLNSKYSPCLLSISAEKIGQEFEKLLKYLRS